MMRIRKFFAMLVDLYTKFFDQFWRAKCKYITYYESLPIQENVILLESEHGKKVNGNIFYVLKYLAQDPKYNNYKLYLSSMGRHKQTFRKFLHASAGKCKIFNQRHHVWVLFHKKGRTNIYQYLAWYATEGYGKTGSERIC